MRCRGHQNPDSVLRSCALKIPFVSLLSSVGCFPGCFATNTKTLYRRHSSHSSSPKHHTTRAAPIHKKGCLSVYRGRPPRTKYIRQAHSFVLTSRPGDIRFDRKKNEHHHSSPSSSFQHHITHAASTHKKDRFSMHRGRP